MTSIYSADNVAGLEGADLIFVDAFDGQPTGSKLDAALYAYIEATIHKKPVRELAACASDVVAQCKGVGRISAQEEAEHYIDNIRVACEKYLPKTEQNLRR